MLRIACVWMTALCLLLLSEGGAEAQKKKRNRAGKRGPAPTAQPAAVPGEPGDAQEAPTPAGDAAAMEISAEELEAGDGQPDGQGEESGASDAQSAAAEAPSQPAAGNAELSALRQELSALMDELVQARAMVATLGKALFKTRVRIMVEDHALDAQRVARIAVYLDGAPVFRGDGGSIPSDPAHPVFEGFAAPGPHELTLELEHRARDNDEYRYSVRNSYRFEVVREHRTDLRLVIDDDSDMAEDFDDDREGSYEVESRLEVVAEPLEK